MGTFNFSGAIYHFRPGYQHLSTKMARPEDGLLFALSGLYYTSGENGQIHSI